MHLEGRYSFYAKFKIWGSCVCVCVCVCERERERERERVSVKLKEITNRPMI